MGRSERAFHNGKPRRIDAEKIALVKLLPASEVLCCEWIVYEFSTGDRSIDGDERLLGNASGQAPTQTVHAAYLVEQMSLSIPNRLPKLDKEDKLEVKADVHPEKKIWSGGKYLYLRMRSDRKKLSLTISLMLKITIGESEVGVDALPDGSYQCPCSFHEQATFYEGQDQLLQHVELTRAWGSEPAPAVSHLLLTSLFL